MDHNGTFKNRSFNNWTQNKFHLVLHKSLRLTSKLCVSFNFKHENKGKMLPGESGKVKPSIKLQFWKRWIKADFWFGFVRLTMPRKSTDETYQNSSKLETIDFPRTCPYRTRNTSENPALALFSVYLLLKARASTSSIFDEKLLIGLVFKSPFGSFRILNLDFHALAFRTLYYPWGKMGDYS